MQAHQAVGLEGAEVCPIQQVGVGQVDALVVPEAGPTEAALQPTAVTWQGLRALVELSPGRVTSAVPWSGLRHQAQMAAEARRSRPAVESVAAV